MVALGWWDLFINYGYDFYGSPLWFWTDDDFLHQHFLRCLHVSLYRIAECFAFLVCTQWYNPAIHRHSHIGESGSSVIFRYTDWNRGLVVSSDEDRHQNGRICNLQDIGGHFMKIPFVGFQIMLFMYLEVWVVLKSDMILEEKKKTILPISTH